MASEYEVFIDDWEPPRPQVTRAELITIINKKLSKKWTDKDWSQGISIDVQPEWKKLLSEDGSILWEYTKLGWKAMHYNKTTQDGEVIRDWLNFKSFKALKGE